MCPAGLQSGLAVLTLSGGDTIGKGAIVEAESGGIVSVTGTVTNSGGTFLALTSGTVDFTSTSNVNGNGVAVVQNGIVEIDGGGTETVDFTRHWKRRARSDVGEPLPGYCVRLRRPQPSEHDPVHRLPRRPIHSGTTSAVFVADATHPTQSGTLEIVVGTTVEAKSNWPATTPTRSSMSLTMAPGVSKSPTRRG